ncbi:hypothetical protein C5Y96_21070 [Blastopirellula marina]|uniref:DUF3784 domain-containing protein n=2 Tax=Pirellulales TaxID=2691354 RepID=A0A2S8F1G9_9BACT|nr:hypothetical protein C5Y96_21070 [Blastopirellula marina]RCS44305.1 hypothetical protein DTL36_21115 [Bremerella cremea]
MELGVLIMTIFTGLLGIGGIWSAIQDTPEVFQSRKIAFLEKHIGRIGARLFVGIGGLLLLILAISFVALPPE